MQKIHNIPWRICMRVIITQWTQLALNTVRELAQVTRKQLQWRQQAPATATYRRLPHLSGPAIEAIQGAEQDGEVELDTEEDIARKRLEGQSGGDKRARNEQNQRSAKRRRLNGQEEIPVYASKFSAEEIAAQERKPKRKVAVMIGYSGSGYKGMQLNHQEKTIEGDLFAAFVAAGAISKANADDPKKSSLVRCARTDKGVHAAGNVISLKLVIEDPDIVTKINERLNPQIRVWGIERTNNSFSAYQVCDSRIYEYLIPSYCFLPPHPHSFLGKQMAELAKIEDDLKGYEERQQEVSGFWKDTEERYVKSVVESMDPSIRDEVLTIFYSRDNMESEKASKATEAAQREGVNDRAPSIQGDSVQVPLPLEQTDCKRMSPSMVTGTEIDPEETSDIALTNAFVSEQKERLAVPIELALRSLKAALAAAKRAHRIPPTRLGRIKSTLSRFVGSHRYHNYTVDKSSRDPSAVRVVKSFTVSDTPIMIGGTEWLSLKVHGQSFMMHQIRKMVSAAALVVRSGCHEGRIQDTYLSDRLSIPKAPSLGLLLEKPVFDVYNEKLVGPGRERIDFKKYEKEMEEFKQREIYERIFRNEEKEGIFLAFFAGLDSTRSSGLLWASSRGVEAIKRNVAKANTGVDVGPPEDIDAASSEDEKGGQDEN